MKNLAMFISGAMVSFIVLTTVNSYNYGRMVEHLNCNRKVEVQMLEQASERYYATINNNN